MKDTQHSQIRPSFPQDPIHGIGRSALVAFVIVFMGYVGSAQTNSTQVAYTQSKPALVRMDLPRVVTGKVTPARPVPIQTAPAAASLSTTNVPTTDSPASPDFKIGGFFLRGMPEFTFSGLKANETAAGGFSLSGIVVQVIKAKQPLQLLNPAAPAQYGSGWDNVERFPASVSGPTLKLFSVNF